MRARAPPGRRTRICNSRRRACSSDLPTGFGEHVREHLQLLFARIPGRHDALDQSSQPPGQGRSVPRRAGISAEPDPLRGTEEEHPLRRAQLAVRSCSRPRPGWMPRRRRATLRSIPSTSPSRNRNSAPNPATIRWSRSMHLAYGRIGSCDAAQAAFEKAKVISTAPPEKLWSARASRSTMRNRAW